MSFRTEARITRRMLSDDRATLFVFGDNTMRFGFGGQAGEMRGEPNAVGIPTKRYPGMAAGDFFADEDFPEWRDAVAPILQQLGDQLRSGGDVVWPADGIGTGLAQLPERAPRIWAALERARAKLVALGAEHPAPPASERAADAPLVLRVLAAFPGATVTDVREAKA